MHWHSKVSYSESVQLSLGEIQEQSSGMYVYFCCTSLGPFLKILLELESDFLRNTLIFLFSQRPFEV